MQVINQEPWAGHKAACQCCFRFFCRYQEKNIKLQPAYHSNWNFSRIFSLSRRLHSTFSLAQHIYTLELMWLTRCQSPLRPCSGECTQSPLCATCQAFRIKITWDVSPETGVTRDTSVGQQSLQWESFVLVRCHMTSRDGWKTQLSWNICFFVQDKCNVNQILIYSCDFHCSKWNSLEGIQINQYLRLDIKGQDD